VENVRNVSLIANQLWHSDSSFKSPPAKYSILCGIDLPGDGGQTEFADQRAAYDGLSDTMKARIEPMVAEHFAFHSRTMLGGSHHSQTEIDALPPVHWPMVHTVPDSGRKSLFIGIHTREIAGLATAEGRMLLHELLEQATQPAYIYRHEWQNGDILMWDNQCTLHRGRPYDFARLRELRRCTTEVVLAAAG
jgi:alpha-ketoglutarate-dependent 2,4-dichlorophenoxyacetate dioxygenase